MTPDSVRIAGAQIAPVWLDRTATLAKVVAAVHRAADGGAQLVAFGEALVPGYPFWIELTDGARFDAPVQKQLHAHYLDQAVQIEAGHLQSVCDAARDRAICVIVGIIERPSDRGGHSIYASLVYIDAEGGVQLGQLRLAQVSSTPAEHRLGQREEIVGVHRGVTVEALVSAHLDFGHMAMERAGDECAHHGAQNGNGHIAGDDHHGVHAHTRDVGIPDVAAGDQVCSPARHALAEKAPRARSSSRSASSGSA